MTGPGRPLTMRLQIQGGDSSVTPDAEGDVRGDTGGDVASAPASPASVAPAGASVAPLSVADRAGIAGRRAAGVARELWLDPGRLLHVIIHGKPETMREHWAHVKSLSWVPKELAGRWRTVIAWAGILHHALVAYPVKGIAKALEFAAAKLDHAADRALTFYLVAIFVLILFFLLARYL